MAQESLQAGREGQPVSDEMKSGRGRWTEVTDEPAKERAIETLALRLFQKMEHLDPTEDAKLDKEDWGWSELTQLQRDFYMTCIRTLLCDPRSLLIALGRPEGMKGGVWIPLRIPLKGGVSFPLNTEITWNATCWKHGPLTEDGCETTCLLPAKHEGDHAWTRNDEIMG